MYNGSLLYGKYASPRDAGNFAAGIFAGKQGVFSPIIHFGYGAYNVSGGRLVPTGLIALGIGGAILNPSTRRMGLGAAASIRDFGEDPLTRRSIGLGEQFYNNGYKF